MNIVTIITSFTFLTSASSIAINALDEDKNKQNVLHNTQMDAQAVEKYWTKEKLEAAIPMSHPVISEKEMKRLFLLNKTDPAKKRKEEIFMIPGSGAGPLTPGGPTKANVGERPYWNGGKLYFSNSAGKGYSCSAQFTGQNNILLTAAHCVRNGSTGEWYKNFVFYRAYNNGGGQRVGWKCAAVYYMWASPKNNYKYDYAFLQTTSTSGAGWLGLQTQIPYANWTAIGYPANFGSNRYMYEVAGNKGTNSSGIVQMENNPMRSGNSGGAWIGDLTIPHVGGNFAIGLNSFHRTGDTTSEYGPLFDSATVKLYQKAIRCSE